MSSDPTALSHRHSSSRKTTHNRSNEVDRSDCSFEWGSSIIDVLPVPSSNGMTPINHTPNQSDIDMIAAQRVQQERLVGAIAQRIRHTLDLLPLVTIAAQELGELLQVDRVEILQHLPEQRVWRHLAEYRRDPEAVSLMEMDVPDQDNPLAERLKRFEVVQVTNVSLVDDNANREFARLSPGCWLLIPLKIREQLWGSLSLVRQQPDGWQPEEEVLIQAAAEQLMIAIEHSQLYQQVQQLNEELEHTVKKRTAQLSQALASESMLKRITDKVRDSLEESQILETVVEELVDLLQLDCCDTGLYNAGHTLCTIAYNHTNSSPTTPGKVIDMTVSYSDVYEQLLNCHHVQFCLLPETAPRTHVRQTVLACSIFDNEGVLGDLWLFRPAAQVFNELEVRLVKQVTNQCAIAIRQARLYQAAQHQVETLEHLNQLKDNFLSTVSHELRTPISSIKMAIQMLTLTLGREGLLPDPNKPSPSSSKIAHYLKILNDECNREISLITDLLDLQQLESSNPTATVQPIELSPYLQRILLPFRKQAENQGQTLEIDIAADLPVILSDAQSLERILVELLTNACKYTSSGETIQLSAHIMAAGGVIDVEQQEKSLKLGDRAVSSTIEIAVTNSGIEISPDQMERIFDKFYRIPSRDPHRHGGTGLGLALVERLALRIGARIAVKSGQGKTCFTLAIPQETM